MAGKEDRPSGIRGGFSRPARPGFDGLVEATQTGNANTFFEPDRSCTWFDGVNHGWKDAYCNAEIYRAWRCLAELESKLHREEKRRRYAELADRLKAAYARVLYNPQTGWIADWRSEDGHLHDYASFVASSMAIEYGLVDLEQGKKMIEKLWAKMQTSGFTRYELGIPPNFDPIHRSDYCQPNGSGARPARMEQTHSSVTRMGESRLAIRCTSWWRTIC